MTADAVQKPDECSEPERPQSDGITTLQDLLDAVSGGKKDDREVAWAKIHRPEVTTALVDCWRFRTEEISMLLNTLEGIPGNAGRVRSLRNVIKRQAAEVARAESEDALSDMLDQATGLQLVSSSLASGAPPPSVVDPAVLDSLRVPRGFELAPNGVFRLSPGVDGNLRRTRIATAPILIVGRTEDVHTGEAKRQMVWRGPSGWCNQTVDRRTIMDAGRIVGLSAIEAPINSITGGQVVSYLSDFEAENSHRFPAVRSSSRMGWLGDGSFLLPDGCYSSKSDGLPYALTPPPGFDRAALGWRAGGEWATWVTGIELVRDSPLMMVAMYASVAAPLLQLLDLSGFIVDYSGETSGGKTTALRLSASVWGKPSESFPTAMYSWDATKVWIERMAGFLCNLPLILDETKRAKHPNIVRDIIYDFCQGQGRGRGAVEGARHTVSWRSIMLSSGESAAVSFSQDAGTRARVLSLKGRPLGDDPQIGGPKSEQLQAILANHYGHLGRRMILYLVGNREHHDAIRAVYHDTRDRYANLIGSAVGRRHAAHLAVLEVAAAIVHQLGVPEPTCEPFAYLLDMIEQAAYEADRPLTALQEVASWCVTNKTGFWGRHELSHGGTPRVPNGGWLGAWSPEDDWYYIAITIPALRQVLHEAGYRYDEIKDRWAERGWLVRSTNARGRSKPVRIAGSLARCYCLDRAAVEIAIAAGEVEQRAVSHERVESAIVDGNDPALDETAAVPAPAGE